MRYEIWIGLLVLLLVCRFKCIFYHGVHRGGAEGAEGFVLSMSFT